MTERRQLALQGAVMLLGIGAGEVAAEQARDAHARAADYATCAAFYFNAVNVKPMAEYEAVYRAGERAFNAGLAQVGRQALDDLVAHASAEMMKLTHSNWQNFERVEQRYAADCARLLEASPAEPLD